MDNKVKTTVDAYFAVMKENIFCDWTKALEHVIIFFKIELLFYF